MTPPTCEDLFNEEGFESVHREDDTSWRHGSYVFEVYHRLADDTYWSASYRQSTDGETNELREGFADIGQVEPYTKTVTAYRPIP